MLHGISAPSADKSEEQFSDLFEFSPDGLILCDQHGKIQLVNSQASQMFGYEPSELIGQSIEILIPNEVRKRHAALRNHYSQAPVRRSMGDAQADLYGLRKDGSLFPTDISIAPIMRNGQKMICAAVRDITMRKEAEKQLAYLARHDELTDLPNRLEFSKRLKQKLKRMHPSDHLAVLYLDLDHFKNVNDTLGHSIGDQLLKAVADRLRRCLRESDLTARWGGDEFVIVQTGITQPKEIVSLANRIQEKIKEPYDIDGQQLMVDVSIGVTVAPADGSDADQLFKNADLALYEAKADGRATFRFFESEMDTRMQRRRAVELDLRKAVANNEFELHYQPIVNLQTEEISCCEALLRWCHPVRGIILPGEFIQIAEDTGLILPIGEWVLRQACHDAASWPENIKVAINLSPVQFKMQNLALTVTDALAKSGLSPRRLELEITESALMRNNKATLDILHQLRALGVSIVMDDFGTGYSSLSYLRSFPFDKIKIDRTFVHDLSRSAECKPIVQAIVELARGLKMTTVAEGVETDLQLKTLRDIGCGECQGYLFCPPKPAEKIARIVRYGGEVALRMRA